MPEISSNKKTSTVLEAIALALMIHVVILTVIVFADEEMFSFSDDQPNSKNVDMEFLELTDELLALVPPEEPDIASLLEKYKNVVAKEGSEISDEVKSYGFNKNLTDEQVLKEMLEFEQNEFNKLKKEDQSTDNGASTTEDGSKNDDPKKPKDNTGNNGSESSYSMATSKFDFSRDPEYRKTPTYMCRLFGQIVVEIVVNRDGEVTSAKGVQGDLSKNCLLQQSESYARKWKFKSNSEAPKSEKGTITFTFLPQKEF